MIKGAENQKNPLVSVILPVYNREKLVVPAIESILDQTYKNIELILVNDGSTDGTLNVLKAYEKKFPEKVMVVNRNRPGGPGGYVASNAGYKIAQGEFINRMDSDDISHPDRIRQQVEFLLKNPDYIMVGTQAYYINDKGEVLGVKKLPTDPVEIYRDFAAVNPLMHPSVLIRKSMLPSQTRLYETKFGINDDYYNLFSLLRFGKAGNLDQPLYFYRVHGANGSLQNFKQLFFDTAKIRLEAVTSFGYRLNPKALLVFAAQLTLALLVPEAWLHRLYFSLRGAAFPSTRLARLGQKLSSVCIAGERIPVATFLI